MFTYEKGNRCLSAALYYTNYRALDASADTLFGGDGDDFIFGGDTEGDVSQFGLAGATADQFQVNFTHTANAEGERSGDDAVEEAFVIFRPTGQIMWALVDGGGQAEINIQLDGQVFDLLA